VQGQQLNGTQFGDRPLNVTAPMSAMAAGVVPAHPGLAMQMQQIQSMQVSSQGVVALLLPRLNKLLVSGAGQDAYRPVYAQ
jgi:hypothetical protein